MNKWIQMLAGLMAAMTGIGTLDAGPAGKEPQVISYKLLSEALLDEGAIPAFSESLKQLEGAHVCITGFAVPYDDPENLQKFLLVEAPGGCYFCQPPAANAVILVRREPKDGRLPHTFGGITVEGTFHLWRNDLKDDDEAKGFLFTIDDAKARVSR